MQQQAIWSTNVDVVKLRMNYPNVAGFRFQYQFESFEPL